MRSASSLFVFTCYLERTKQGVMAKEHSNKVLGVLVLRF